MVFEITGCPRSNFPKSICSSSLSEHISWQVGKACWRKLPVMFNKLKKCKKYEKNTFCHMKCWDMKHILALPTCQKICSDKELEQIDFGKFDLGHPVVVVQIG